MNNIDYLTLRVFLGDLINIRLTEGKSLQIDDEIYESCDTRECLHVNNNRRSKIGTDVNGISISQELIALMLL